MSILRLFVAVLLLALALTTVINPWQALCLPLFYVSKPLYRKLEGVSHLYFALLFPFLLEFSPGIKYVFSGERLPQGENVILISNHLSSGDWMIFFNLALRRGCAASIRFIMKAIARVVPAGGWACWFHEHMFIKRSWSTDKPYMTRQLSSFADHKSPLWLVLYPEGTYVTPEFKWLKEKSQKFSKENGLPVLEHVLGPRTKGFSLVVEQLRYVDAIYDCTIAFSSPYDVRLGEVDPPAFKEFIDGSGPSEIYVHLERIPMSDIPTDEAGIELWCQDTFQRKDQLLQYFRENGVFPGPSWADDYSMFQTFGYLIVVVSVMYASTCLMDAIWGWLKPITVGFAVFVSVFQLVFDAWNQRDSAKGAPVPVKKQQ